MRVNIKFERPLNLLQPFHALIECLFPLMAGPGKQLDTYEKKSDKDILYKV